MKKNNKLDWSFNDIESTYKDLMRVKALAQKGKIQDAKRLCKELIKAFPGYYAAHRELSKIYIEEGKFYSAFQHLAVALAGDQGDYFCLLNLEALFYELGMYETGRDFSTLIDFIGDKKGIRQHSEVHIYNKGKILLKNKEYEEASKEFVNCLLKHPDNVEIARNLIECYENTGELQKALNIIEKFIDRDDESRNSFVCIASTFPYSLIQKNLEKYISILEKTTENDDKEIQRLFSLARFYHMDERYSQAWETITRANELVKSDVKGKYNADKKWQSQFLEWAQNTNINLPRIDENEPGALPVYILGPSRSGKSCLENALSRLPGVKCGFENKMLSNAASLAFNAGDRLPATFLPFLPEQLLPDFVARYRTMFQENTKGEQIYTTTTPGLITSVGAIIYALPRSKFIVLARDHLDTALRMYFKQYRDTHFHSCDIDWSLDYIKWYNELVEIWEEKFPGAVMKVNYEELVTNPDTSLKSILDFLEIEGEVPGDMVIPDDRGFSKPYYSMYK